jgi:hypothetical protein
VAASLEKTLLAALFLALSWIGPAWTAPSPLSGSVREADGRPVAAVTLELRAGDGRGVDHASSDRRGRFAIGPAQAGVYELVATKAGFQPTAQTVTFPAAPGKLISIILAPAPRPTVVGTLVVRGQSVPAGPGASVTGANDYAVSAQDILDLPSGTAAPLTDVLAQMPGVAIDQNQQIHIRDTEGPQFQYQINGILVPLDINTNPPFVSMINPLFIQELDLLDGVLPSRYSYATGGVVDIKTKDGCEQPGGGATILVGQRQVLQPNAQFGGCDGKFSYYVSGLYDEGQTAFSPATAGANPVHDYTNQGQAFGFLSYQLDASTRLSLTLSAAASDNQLPNVPNLAPQFVLAGAPPAAYQSANINSYLNFQDYLAIAALNGSAAGGLTYQLAYSAHYISQDYRPDDAGELIFQGVASQATHVDVDNTLEGDLTDRLGRHSLGAGFYVGEYHVTADDSSLVFPVDATGAQSSPTPVRVITNTAATNVVLGVYLDDLWQITQRLRASYGVRLDSLSGFTNHVQLDPSANLAYQLTDDVAVHGGYARYMQVPSFQGISPGAPAAFAGTTAASGPGIATPLAEDDEAFDVGLTWRINPHLSFSQDDYYELTDHYLDTGQFGVVPIFAPFNYDHGHIWGSEFAVKYRDDHLSAYANLTFGQNRQQGVATGQFNFDPDELALIDAHGLLLDHQPLVGASAGATYTWRSWTVGFDGVYSSGLRGGFADQAQLPNVVQVNASIQRAFHVPGLGKVTDRLTILNLFDTVNLIRPAEGIGVFQSAYGPRFTVLDSVTLAF